jgi:hypothetical protein
MAAKSLPVVTTRKSLLGAPPANRYLIIQYPSKDAADKHWADSVQKWWDSEGHKYGDFRAIAVEAAGQ